ncbi:MAG TPA: hypothetical protein ENH23_01530 [candidate division Zixibacteria bacterium]|nr:hypothetical protein [candidate division Zixibacteria bacterium]
MIFKLDKKKIIYILVFIIGIIVSSKVSAQDVANGSATANVQAALAIVATQDLQFGSVFQGVAKSVANNDAAAAGIFTITGEASAGISAYMTLPQYIATATGDDRMNIAFQTTDLSIDSTLNADPSAFGDGWLDVDPNNIPNGLVIGSDLVSHTMLFLGGRVLPSVDQSAGAYSGNIIVTVAYNGN